MNLNEFLKSDAAKKLADKAKTLKSVEEVMSIAKEQDIEVTEEEAKKILSISTSKQKLLEDDLDNVTGGEDINISNDNPRCVDCGGQIVCIDGKGEEHGCGIFTYSIYQCQNCGEKYDHVWNGDYWRRN